MGRVPQYKRIVKEEFEPENQDLVGRLAFPINSFHEEVRNLFNANIDFNNLNQEIITVTVSVDSDGNPLTETKYKSNLNTRVRGMTCIRSTNNTDSSNVPSATPFATFTQNTNIVTINNISGLTANEQYQLVFLTIG